MKRRPLRPAHGRAEVPRGGGARAPGSARADSPALSIRATRRRPAVAACALAAAIGLLVACGGGAHPPPGTGASDEAALPPGSGAVGPGAPGLSPSGPSAAPRSASSPVDGAAEPSAGGAEAPAPSPAASSPGAGAGGTRPAPGAAPRYQRGRVAWISSPADHLVALSIARAADDGVWLVGNNESLFTARDDLVVERLAADGISRWQSWGIAKWGRALAVTGDRVWVLSELSGRLRFGGQALDATDARTDLALLRVGGDGRTDLGRVLATPDFDRADGLAAMPDGGVIVAHGAFVAPARGPLAFAIVGSRDALVTRLGPEGDVLWTRNLGVPGYDEATALATDGEGRVFVGGTRWDSADMAIPSHEDAAHRPFVARLEPSGAVSWVRELRHAGSARLSHLVVHPDGRLVYAGTSPRRGGAAAPAGGGEAFVGRLGLDGAPIDELPRREVGCLVVGDGGVVLVASRRGLAQLDDVPRELVAFDPAQVLDLRACAPAGRHAVFLAGQAKPGGLVAGVPVPPPRAVRAPRWMSSYEAAFVARVDLGE